MAKLYETEMFILSPLKISNFQKLFTDWEVIWTKTPNSSVTLLLGPIWFNDPFQLKFKSLLTLLRTYFDPLFWPLNLSHLHLISTCKKIISRKSCIAKREDLHWLVGFYQSSVVVVSQVRTIRIIFSRVKYFSISTQFFISTEIISIKSI